MKRQDFIPMALAIFLLGITLPPAFSFQDYSHINSETKICGDHICAPGEYKALQNYLNNAQMQKGTGGFNFAHLTKPYFDPIIPSESTQNNTRPNYIMDIHIPNHVDYFSVILTYNDFQLLKNNIGVFAAVGVGGSGSITTTTLPENINYCNLANAIWDGQDQSFKDKYGKGLVVPPYCGNPVPVPEFNYAPIILVIGVMTTLFVCLASFGKRLFHPATT